MYTVRRHKTSKIHHSCCIGILTIPHMKKTKYGSTHIMKPYVDWFEDRGVRVIPIPYDTTEHKKYFKMINGLFIPGGETPYIMRQKGFVETVTRFFELSLAEGEYFPIWGTCFGFEILMFLIGNFDKLNKVPAHGLYPISITRDGIRSRLFGSFTLNYINYLITSKSTSQNHEYGITPTEFVNNDNLNTFYDILATSKDENGKEYVAAIEGKYCPVYGVSWHPERQQSSAPFVEFFISELKKNKHKCKFFSPFLRNVLKPHKCTQYPEHRNLLCYFF